MTAPAALLVAAVLSLVTLTAAPALAQPAGADDVSAARDRARPLAERGFVAYQGRRWAEAIELFGQAEEFFHAPPHLLYIARAYERLGRLVEARDAYLAVASEQLAEYAPDPFRQAQQEAKVELAELRKRIPSLQIVISGAPADRARLRVDERELDEVPPLYEVNPGKHVVVATAGALSVTREVVVSEGQSATVELDVPAARDQEDESMPLWVPAVAAFGLAAANVVVGSITGAVSLSQVDDIEARCVDGHCPADAEPDADDAALLGNLSTASFVIAGVAAAAGTTLLLIDLSDDGDADASSLEAWVGVGGAGLVLLF